MMPEAPLLWLVRGLALACRSARRAWKRTPVYRGWYARRHTGPCVCRCPESAHAPLPRLLTLEQAEEVIRTKTPEEIGRMAGFRGCDACRCFAYRPSRYIVRWYDRRAEKGDLSTPYPWRVLPAL